MPAMPDRRPAGRRRLRIVYFRNRPGSGFQKRPSSRKRKKDNQALDVLSGRPVVRAVIWYCSAGAGGQLKQDPGILSPGALPCNEQTVEVRGRTARHDRSTATACSSSSVSVWRRRDAREPLRRRRRPSTQPGPRYGAPAAGRLFPTPAGERRKIIAPAPLWVTAAYRSGSLSHRPDGNPDAFSVARSCPGDRRPGY